MADMTRASEVKGSRQGGRARKVILALAIWAALGLGARMAIQVLAAEPATAAFDQTWARTDDPVASGLVDRTWMWGEEANTEAMSEPYTESPGGQRAVQYFDKSRMEDNSFRASAPWDVTNGLLVVELVSGKLQLGDDDFGPTGAVGAPHAPAEVNVAGDRDDPTGVQYATLASLLDAQALPDGATITHRLDRAGNVTEDPALASHNVTAAHLVSVPGIEHQIASPFWEFMNSSGAVYENGAYVDALMFLNPFYATGYPITEAYWANVQVAGAYQDVLLQCFERRCLTYTPGNDPGWQVEAGNVGLHYYAWRYEQIPGEEPPAGTPDPSPTATATEEPGETPTATEGPEPSATPEPDLNYSYAGGFGEANDITTAFDYPIGVGVDRYGYVYILEAGTDRVQKYTPDGVLVAIWGGSGSGAGQFDDPSDIAFDSAGNAYVTDWDNDRVQVFNRDGNQIGTFGSSGNGDGQFNTVGGIAFDSEGYIYVTDTNNNRVQKFDANGIYVDQWGTFGSADGQLFLPYGIAIAEDDRIYVADSGNERVQVFDTEGNHLGGWGGVEGSGNGQFDDPFGIAVNEDGIVYVADYLNNRVQIFTSSGSYIRQWGTTGADPGQFIYPEGIAVDDDGNVYVVDDADRVQKFDARGNFLDQWSDGRRGRLADSTCGMTLDEDGDVYLSDLRYSRIQRFDGGGDFEHEFGEPGSGAGQLDGPCGMAATPDGYIYVADIDTSRILKFTIDGNYVTEWGGFGSGAGQFWSPGAVAVDRHGDVYVTDGPNSRVQKFSENGSYIGEWGGYGTGDGEFIYPSDIAIDGDLVYVLDIDGNRVQVFDLDGNYLGQWGEYGSGDGQFSDPIGMAVDGDGYVYVVDTGNFRVQKFSPTGNYLTQFGSEGSGPGQFTFPTRIEIAEDGDVYVFDSDQYAVQVFR